MSILKRGWNKIKDAAKKTAKKALSGVTDNSAKAVKPDAQMGPSGSGDASSRAASMAERRKRQRGARGRDSTIIATRSELGSRTLLG
jgi:hypothetical protein